ncbi:MAG: hypothetical protein PHU25_20975 [Deltaproteobacteria bacterium]|nr:hypothetical protein [Deltaproteobacteria bacterium]
MERDRDKGDELLDDLVSEDGLPPLDDDALDDLDPAVTACYLDEPVAAAEDPGEGTDAQALEEALACAELEAVEDDGDGDPAEVGALMECTDADVEDEDRGWSGGDDGMALEDDWFVDDREDEPVGADDGDDGPLEDPVDLAESASVSGGEDDEDDERIEDVMARLGIALPGAPDEDGEPLPAFEHGAVFETVSIGPEQGRVIAVGIAGGALVAVGDGVYLVGADGLLHRREGSQILEGALATSLTALGGEVFLGSARGGAFATADLGATLAPMNDWYELGLNGPGRAGAQPVSTTFDILGQVHPGGNRLLGLTGEGQLFASDSLGRAWSGPVTHEPCRAVGVLGNGEVLALVESLGRLRLRRSSNLSSWTDVPLPGALAATVSGAALRLASGGQTVAAAVDDPDAPLFLSLDGGRAWRELQIVKGVTAVAVDAEDGALAAVAVTRPSSPHAQVLVSPDGGATWKTVLVLREAGARVTHLAIDVGRLIRVAAVADGKVRVVTLAGRGLPH